jgi:hypothetical protein
MLQAQPGKNQSNALNRKETSLQDTRAHLHEVPTFIYSYEFNTDQLYRTSHWRKLKSSSAFIHLQVWLLLE